ncbi:hypothetical protein C8R45DRAFT_1180537 [Mycena sanguinolenta]|nr:hypothetical protein C8R45DRAFT_1180537 [Mycena sanguinolenta]
MLGATSILPAVAHGKSGNRWAANQVSLSAKHAPVQLRGASMCESGTGGAGGEGYANGKGGSGGDGMGASLNCDIHGDVIMNNAYHHGETALAAIHDSMDSFPQPKCHLETRTEMLRDLREWAVDTDSQTTILWLYGPAGAGKSAIMQTLAGQLRDAGRLDTHFRPFAGHADRDAATILIDGLDECEGNDVQEEILRVIRTSSLEYPLPLRFIVASRPEPHISEMFQSPFYSGHYRPVDVRQSFHDVRKYLQDEFARIHLQHRTMAKIPSPWPSQDVLEDLVEKSSGHFIYASTIIKFIDDKSYRPTQRLALVHQVNSPCSESVFGALDQLYMTILSSAPRQSELNLVLCAIVNLVVDPRAIDRLFGLADGEARLLLRGLHSLLSVLPDDEYKRIWAIYSHHASFLDFLNNPSRSRNFCVATLNRRIDLARTCLQWLMRPCSYWEVRWWGGREINEVITLITSLPPSAEAAELFPLLESMNPENIFDSSSRKNPDFGSMIAWLRRALHHDECDSPLVPTDHPLSPGPDLLRILVPLMLNYTELSKLRGRLGLTWTEFRTTICSPCSNVARTELGIPASAFRLACRDVALRYIRTMVKIHIDTGGEVFSWDSRDVTLESIRTTFIDTRQGNYTVERRVLNSSESILVTISTDIPSDPILHFWSNYHLRALNSIGSSAPFHPPQCGPLGIAETY